MVKSAWHLYIDRDLFNEEPKHQYIKKGAQDAEVSGDNSASSNLPELTAEQKNFKFSGNLVNKIANEYIIDQGFPMIENFYSDSLADTPLALLAEKAHLVTNKASTVIDWPELDAETMAKVKKKIDTGWNSYVKED